MTELKQSVDDDIINRIRSYYGKTSMSDSMIRSLLGTRYGLSNIDVDTLSIYTITISNKILNILDLIGNDSNNVTKELLNEQYDDLIDYVIDSLEYVNSARLQVYKPSDESTKIQDSQKHRVVNFAMYSYVIIMLFGGRYLTKTIKTLATSDKYSKRVEEILYFIVKVHLGDATHFMFDDVDLKISYFRERRISLIRILDKYMNDDTLKPMTQPTRGRMNVIPNMDKSLSIEATRDRLYSKIENDSFIDITKDLRFMLLGLGDIMSGVVLTVSDEHIKQTAINVGLISVYSTVVSNHPHNGSAVYKKKEDISNYDNIVHIKTDPEYYIPSFKSPIMEKVLMYYPMLSDIDLNIENVDHDIFEEFDDGLISTILKYIAHVETIDIVPINDRITYDEITGLYNIVNGRSGRNDTESKYSNIDIEDVRSGARTATKKVVRTKKQIDTSVDKKIVSPVAKNLEDLITGLTSNDVKNEKEKRAVRENIQQGRYTAKFLITKFMNHLALKAVITVIAGPAIGMLINTIITYLDIKRTKAVTDKERRRMNKDYEDALEIMEMKINSEDNPKKKIQLVKMQQKLKRSQAKIKFNDDSVDKKG